MLERIKELCKKHDMNVYQLEEALGFGRNTIYQWNKRTPGVDKLKQVADYFNVTTDYLLGRNQAPMWAEKSDLIELDKMLDSNVNMAFNGENLTAEEKQRVKDILTGLFWEYAEKDKTKK
ncbi:hypothetical protein RV11_GL003470 [Enterococcus phoeniculicola]|uniref:HTH cro/C1-type domain-containing protein n=1 Tax=Enterococcus phoeniculicola ATCC BAA-412 TaxID=1158610 RepID=R3TM00_9ENTE|nr:helix-turn-helix transcriptional regulator [Enterococcus phoeniculicola]EOL42038.1 hypothetical protein UC3_02386 [Enterococcus phoeniculicola ATCC BAA-412]EOT79683.1 hypothetical protein I589_01195 [Enterococcus phoeniculicola ATCC BAA-412]OJG71749.1 hypothetical protein RV11_GL003470 [Enterococcus phoeniculicola]